MTKPGAYQVLNRLLTTLYRSLPIYLTYAVPWTHRGEEQALATLRNVANQQKEMASRIGRYLLEHHGPLEMGEYAIDFLDLHDLSLDFLITRLVEAQKHDVATIQRCVEQLKPDRQASALAEEALGEARAQLEILEELAERLASSTS
jgi:hypothetical protein